MNLDSRIFTQKKPEKPRVFGLRELRPAHHVRKSDLTFLHEHGMAATVLKDWERCRRHDKDAKEIAAWP